MHSNYADRDVIASNAKAEASSADAVITIVAEAEEFWALDWIAWSYAETPSAGSLNVTIGGTEVLDFDIVEGGPGLFDFNRQPLYTNLTAAGEPKKNEEVVITLVGAGTVGKVNVRYR